MTGAELLALMEAEQWMEADHVMQEMPSDELYVILRDTRYLAERSRYILASRRGTTS